MEARWATTSQSHSRGLNYLKGLLWGQNGEQQNGSKPMGPLVVEKSEVQRN